MADRMSLRILEFPELSIGFLRRKALIIHPIHVLTLTWSRSDRFDISRMLDRRIPSINDKMEEARRANSDIDGDILT